MGRCCGTSDIKVANFYINHPNDQLEVTLTNGQTFSVSKSELGEWLDINDNVDKIDVIDGKLVIMKENGSVQTIPIPAAQVNPASNTTVGTVRFATTDEAIAGTATDVALSPATGKALIASQLQGFVNGMAATDTTAGLVSKATQVVDNAGNSLGFLVD